MIIAICILLLTFNLHAKENDFSDIDDLVKAQDQKIKYTHGAKMSIERPKYSIVEVEALKVQLEEIKASPLFRAHIKRGTKLIDINEGKIYYTQRNIAVRAHTKLDFEKFRYLSDKLGNVRYKVLAVRVIPTKTISSIYELPVKFTPVTKIYKTTYDDKKLDYQIGIKTHLGYNIPSYTADLFEKEALIGTIGRFELLATTGVNLPIYLGVTTGLTSLSGKLLSGGQYSVKTYTLGAALETKRSKDGYYLGIYPKASTASTAVKTTSSGTSKYILNESALLFSFEREVKTDLFGIISFGINYQRKWITASDTSSSVQLDTENNYDDSVALSFGHKSEYTW